MYNLYGFGRMIDDASRMRAYRKALEQRIIPGSVVVDIGTGTGIFALIACQLGASRVYAIDPNDLIEVAKKVARENGFADRIEFLQQLSMDISLPEKADGIVSDLRGVLPFFSANIPALIDARERFLKPGGFLLPEKDTVSVALVNAKKAYQAVVNPWHTRKHGLKMQSALKAAVNNLQRVQLHPRQVIVTPEPWAVIDYPNVQSPNSQNTLEFEIGNTALAHGFGMWFETEIIQGIGYSTSPFAPPTVYWQMFFPFERPLKLSPKDRVILSISANRVGDEYIWRWRTTHYKDRTGQKTAAAFDQSTFYGTPLNPEKLRKQADGWTPGLTIEGIIDRAILALMDGTRSLVDIAKITQETYPEHFPTAEQALERVKKLSEKYSE